MWVPKGEKFGRCGLLTAVDIPGVKPDITEFVLGLLRTGFMLSELASNLTDALPADAYPGEDPAAVVLEMICGTIATALDTADPRGLRHATELIELASARTREHLQLARAMSRRIHGSDGSQGRSYG